MTTEFGPPKNSAFWEARSQFMYLLAKVVVGLFVGVLVGCTIGLMSGPPWAIFLGAYLAAHLKRLA